MKNKINIRKNKQLLSILLKDKTTNRNLIWATDNYEQYGKCYKSNYPICINLITGANEDIIKFRVKKTKKNKNHEEKIKPKFLHLHGYVTLKIISWNIWQMDGINLTIPNTKEYCKIMDWDKHKSINFIDLIE